MEAIEVSNILHVIDTNVIFHDKTLGCTGNTRFCLEYGFKEHDYVLHLEDDTYPSIDLLEYFEQVERHLYNGYFAACTFHRPCHQDKPDQSKIRSLVSKFMFEGAGGFSMTKKQWERILEMGGMFGVYDITPAGRQYNCRGEDWLKEIVKDDKWGFDWPFDRYFSEGKPSIYPVVGRVLNIGKHGLHLNANQWQKMQYNEFWAHHPDYLPYISSVPTFFESSIMEDISKYTEEGVV